MDFIPQYRGRYKPRENHKNPTLEKRRQRERERYHSDEEYRRRTLWRQKCRLTADCPPIVRCGRCGVLTNQPCTKPNCPITVSQEYGL